ncbi:MAG TPA: ATP-binding cassette domain-containing protein [Thermoleophilia bacterium]|nr:ATP-binding cassette domain-containing protein [Thermoleophilia bacterium]
MGPTASAVEDAVAASPADGSALDVSGLRHRFGDLVAVDGLTLQVCAGEIVGLVGRNGAGKTTTMRAVMGILDPQHGAIRWCGHTVGPADRLRFGYMPEERGLYPQMRVFDQLVYFARLHGLDTRVARAEARDWLDRLGLRGRELNKLVALSHGNQQRVQFAVALVHRPDLLVLDEAFAGLDPAAVDVLSDVLRGEARRGAATLFSSHQLDVVERLCDRIVILEQGKVLAEGTLADLRAQAPRRLRVKVDTATDWTAGLSAVRVARRDADGVVLALEPEADTQAILRAALAAGPVEHFAVESGRLIDLYRSLVAS